MRKWRFLLGYLTEFIFVIHWSLLLCCARSSTWWPRWHNPWVWPKAAFLWPGLYRYPRWPVCGRGASKLTVPHLLPSKYHACSVETPVSLCSPHLPGTQYVKQAGFRLTEIPSAGIKGARVPPGLVSEAARWSWKGKVDLNQKAREGRWQGAGWGQSHDCRTLLQRHSFLSSLLHVRGSSGNAGPLHRRTAGLRSKGHWGHPSLSKHWGKLFSGFQRGQQGWWDGSAGKGTCCWAWWPEFCPWDPHGGRGELTETCPLTSTYVLWCATHVCTCTHRHRHI